MPSGALVFLVVWVGMAIGFGLWMLVWPKHYWKTWKSYLKGGDPFERWFPGRTASLKEYVHRPNATRRARIQGALFIAVGLTVALLFGFGILSPK